MLNKYIAMLVFSISVSAHAAVIDAGRFTRDTATGLDWLDVTETRGLSYDEVEAQLAQGGAFQGWRFATVQELDQLITNFGYVAIGIWDCGYELINCDDYFLYPTLTQNQEIVEYMIRTLGDTESAYLEESDSKYQVSPTGAGATSGFLQWFEANAGDGMLPWGLIQDNELVDGTDSTLSDSADIVMSWYIHRQDQANPDLGSFLVRPSEGSIPTALTVIEAESMALGGGYAVEDNAAASGGQLIRRLDSGGYAATASTQYAGPAGSYDIVVSYFDEYDGVSSLAFLLNGEMLDQWIADEDPACRECASPNESTLRSRVVARNIRLSPGDEIALQGTGEHYEYARFDKITVAPVSSNIIEAEKMTLEGGYAVEDNAAASGGQLIRRRDSGGYAATASTQYAGQPGSYDIAVSYFDEYDGISGLAFLLNGEMLDQWIADEDPACSECASPNESTLRSRVVARDVRLSTGDEIALQGTGEHYEYARFDKITFHTLEPLPQSPVVFDDGGVHLIDYNISTGIRVENATSVTVAPGVTISGPGTYVAVLSSASSVTVNGGLIEGEIDVQPGSGIILNDGHIDKVYARETTRALKMTGGSLGQFYSYFGWINVSGGEIGTASLFDGDAIISNGVIGSMYFDGSTSFSISGGRFEDKLLVNGYSGGRIEGGAIISTIEVLGYSAFLTLKGELTLSEPIAIDRELYSIKVSGILSDGTPIDTDIECTIYEYIEEDPDPDPGFSSCLRVYAGP